jgi:hypothetical protein
VAFGIDLSAIFTAADAEFLARPHIARAWFAELDLPSGVSYLHSGIGRVQVGGHEWIGVTDPLSGRLVAIEQIEEPAFGQAAAVTITLSGANKEFIQSVHATAAEIEGRAAMLYWAAFDGETQAVWSAGLKPMFPAGRMTAPMIQWQGIGVRTVSLTIENQFVTQNYPPGGRWNSADQRRRYPGDKGLDYIGVEILETWT